MTLSAVAALVGRGATISARAGHPSGAGEWIERAIALADEIGAAGVNTAHSGTVTGILLDAWRRQSKPAYRRARAAFPDAAASTTAASLAAAPAPLNPPPAFQSPDGQ